MGLFDLNESAQRAADVASGGLNEVFSRGGFGLGDALSRGAGLGDALSGFGQGLGLAKGITGIGPSDFAGYGVGQAGARPGLDDAFGGGQSVGEASWQQLGQGIQSNLSVLEQKRQEAAQQTQSALDKIGKAKDAAVNAVSTAINPQQGAVDNVLRYKDQIESAAKEFNVPANVLAGLIDFESSGNPNAVSPVGARGLTQLMPATARGLGVNPDDPTDNIRGGAKYLRQQYEKYGDWNKALVAYNAGSYEPTASYQGFTADQYAQVVGERANRYGSIEQHTGDGDWLTTAKTHLGQAYVWGGTDPNTGFDCSGFVSWTLKQQGYDLSGTTFTLFPRTRSVSAQDADAAVAQGIPVLVFYNMDSQDPHVQHVARYIGGGQVIQSGGSARSVNVASVNQAIGSPPIFRIP